MLNQIQIPRQIKKRPKGVKILLSKAAGGPALSGTTFAQLRVIATHHLELIIFLLSYYLPSRPPPSSFSFSPLSSVSPPANPPHPCTSSAASSDILLSKWQSATSGWVGLILQLLNKLWGNTGSTTSAPSHDKHQVLWLSVTLGERTASGGKAATARRTISPRQSSTPCTCLFHCSYRDMVDDYVHSQNSCQIGPSNVYFVFKVYFLALLPDSDSMGRMRGEYSIKDPNVKRNMHEKYLWKVTFHKS